MINNFKKIKHNNKPCIRFKREDSQRYYIIDYDGLTSYLQRNYPYFYEQIPDLMEAYFDMRDDDTCTIEVSDNED